MLSYYPCDKETIGWYKKIIIQTLQMLLLNSYSLYNMFNKMIPFYDFRLKVIRGLLPQEALSTNPSQRRLPIAIRMPEKCEKRDQKNKTKRKRCGFCYNQGKVTRTSYKCTIRPDKPGLCVNKCFEKYHDNCNQKENTLW